MLGGSYSPILPTLWWVNADSGRWLLFYSYTTVYSAPSGFEHTIPYTVALVQLEEGPLVTAQLTDVDDENVEIGMPVEMVTRRLRQDGDERGMLVYGYKFRPKMTMPA